MLRLESIMNLPQHTWPSSIYVCYVEGKLLDSFRTYMQ